MENQDIGAGPGGRVMELWLQVYRELTLLSEVVTFAVNDPMMRRRRKRGLRRVDAGLQKNRN